MSPSADRVDVWRVDLRPSPGSPADELLSDEERRRAARFRFDRHRRRFVVSRIALRLLLGRAMGVAPAEVRYRVGPHGKPSVAGDGDRGQAASAVRFNVSRSGDLALVALTRSAEIGVDVEVISVHPEADRVAREFFAADEIELVGAADGDEGVRRFLQIWTRKEAVLKAAGTGLAGRLADFSVVPRSREWTSVRSVAGFAGWVRQIDVGPGYVAALAVQGRARPGVRVRDFVAGAPTT